MTNSEKLIITNIINQIRKLVVNQCMYQYEFEATNELILARNRAADSIDHDKAYSFLVGKPIISFDVLMELVVKIGVEYIFDEEKCCDSLADHIVDHQPDVKPLWDFLDSKIKPPVLQYELN